INDDDDDSFAKGGKTGAGDAKFNAWYDSICAYAKKYYLLDPNDMGIEDKTASFIVEGYKNNETPQEFIDYIAEKHDLD
ncbi:hypothetical protein, partial [Streptococcus pneumoniae]|uniref:hypothetical protein n=1 Tax=Streptococcus pneumoniae TaxID=1313 RepID=UPI0018B05B57